MDAAQAAAYANAGLDASNVEFGEQVLQAVPALTGDDVLQVLDVGAGPGDIGIWLAQRAPSIRVTLLDASADMLRFAEERVAAQGLQDRIEILCGRVPDLELEAGAYDVLISNTFLHHVPEPRAFWAWARPRVRAGGRFFVRDLRRPDDAAQVDALVARYAGDAAPIHREDYRNSYFAALTPEEVAADLEATGLSALSCGPWLDRYWVVAGQRS